MRTIQMTLDDDLVQSVNQIVKELKSTRSEFTREALREAIQKFLSHKQEEKHKKGYELQPVNTEEFSVWEEEQAWG